MNSTLIIVSLILDALYNISKANTNNKEYSNAIENSTNLNSENASDCISYLETKGFLMFVRPKPTDTNFDLISITKEGILELETQKKDKQKTKTIEDFFRHNDGLIFINYAKEDYDYTNKLYNNLKLT